MQKFGHFAAKKKKKNRPKSSFRTFLHGALQLVNQCQQSLLNCLSYNIISSYRVDERRIEEFGPDRYMYFLSHQCWS